jgi:hypothetical protein
MARYGYRDEATRQRHGYRYPHSRKYMAEGSNPVDQDYNKNNLYPAAEVAITMPAEVPLKHPRLESNPRAIRGEIIDTGGILSNKEVDKLSAAQTETPQMFIPQPGVVSSAFSHPSMRHSTGKLLGVAFDDLKGHRLMASSNLSAHSSKLVQKALDAGILEPNPDNPKGIVTNDLSFEDDMVQRGPTDFDYPRTAFGLGFTGGERSTESVNFASRALMRRLNPKPSPQVTEPEPDYEQLKLDGI